MNEFSKEDIDRLDEELEDLLEQATPVRARVAKDFSTVFSVRIAPKELDEVYEAAKARGMTLSEFMRAATRAAIHGDIDLMRASAPSDVRKKVKELNEAIEKLSA